MRSRVAGTWLLLSVGCGASAPAPDAPPPEGSTDACEGLDLPICPPECTAPPAILRGQVCDGEGNTCGNDVGDGCTCAEGLWSCTVRASFSPECSLACRRLAR